MILSDVKHIFVKRVATVNFRIYRNCQFRCDALEYLAAIMTIPCRSEKFCMSDEIFEKELFLL